MTGVGVAFAGSSTTAGNPSVSALAAAATTAPASPSTTPKRAAGKHAAGRRPRPLGLAVLANRLQHGQVVIKDKNGSDVTVLLQHGSVTAVSTSSISLRSQDGFTGSYAIASSTRVRIDGTQAALSGVKAGDQAWVTARESGSTATVTLLVDRTK